MREIVSPRRFWTLLVSSTTSSQSQPPSMIALLDRPSISSVGSFAVRDCKPLTVMANRNTALLNSNRTGDGSTRGLAGFPRRDDERQC
ncbi:hypothetical protein PENTCL1PPCAC_7580, partial [Pristionchus entomophagus]